MGFAAHYLSWSYSFLDRVYKPHMDHGKMEGVKYALKLGTLTYASEYMRAIANGKEIDEIGFEDVSVRAAQQMQVFPFSFVPLLPDGHPNCSTCGHSNCSTWPPVLRR